MDTPKLNRTQTPALDAREGSQRAAKANDSMPAFTLPQLAWLRQVAFFRDDMRCDLAAMGVGEDDAMFLASTSCTVGVNIVQWWTDYGQSNLGPIMLRYLEKQLSGYRPNP